MLSLYSLKVHYKNSWKGHLLHSTIKFLYFFLWTIFPYRVIFLQKWICFHHYSYKILYLTAKQVCKCCGNDHTVAIKLLEMYINKTNCVSNNCFVFVLIIGNSTYCHKRLTIHPSHETKYHYYSVGKKGVLGIIER